MKSTSNFNDRKLIDRLPIGPWTGKLLGFLATTYELQTEFFETDFLPTLLGLGAWDDRNWSSRIALEKRLAELESGVLLLDAHRYRGRPRSMRIDVVPVSPNAGCTLHAKVVCCVFDEAVRLTVGSSNLTEPGYRRNLEVAAVLTASAAQPSEAALMAGAIRELGDLFEPWLPRSYQNLQSVALQRLDGWARTGPPSDRFFLYGGGEKPLWRRFLDHWPAAEQINRISIVSPFWSEESEQGPVTTLVSKLRQSNLLAAESEMLLFTEAVPDSEGSFKPKLPESFQAFDACALGIRAHAVAVAPTIPKDEIVELGLGSDYAGIRGLHAKVVLFEGRRSSLVYLGSANFTHMGWGFLQTPRNANIEAGLAILRTGSTRDQLRELLPRTIGESVPLAGAAAGRLMVSEPMEDQPPWPAFLKEVLLCPSAANDDQLELSANIAKPATGWWRISIPRNESAEGTVLLDVAVSDSENSNYRALLTKEDLRRLLQEQEVLVQWWSHPDGCKFPINIDAAARLTLPISPAGGQPEERHLISYYQGQLAWEDLFPDPEPVGEKGAQQSSENDLSGVDTSRIQSYIVREFVEAIQGIKDDLHAAAKGNSGSMRLALLGSVSPWALAKRIKEAADVGERTPAASGFQLVEILGCLHAAKNFETNARYSNDWQAIIEEAAGRVTAMLGSLQLRFPQDLSQTFQRYEQSVRRHYTKRASRP